MKKIFQKLSNSALKRNKAFSAGLFVLLMLMAMVSSLSASFSKTVQGSVENFIETADMPDGFFNTGGTANYWSIRLEDGLSSEERQEAMDRAGEVFGDRTLNVL